MTDLPCGNKWRPYWVDNILDYAVPLIILGLFFAIYYVLWAYGGYHP